MNTPPKPQRAAHGLRRIMYSATLVAGLLPQTTSADLVAWWHFDQPITGKFAVDQRAGLTPLVLGGAVQTADGAGRSGTAGDRAMTFGIAQQRLHLTNAGYFTAAAAGDIMTVSYWIRHNILRNATPLAFVAPSTVGARGFQAHTPWSDSTTYFDTGGCCDANQRISVGLAAPSMAGFVWGSTWHNVVLVKNGSSKEIIIDGLSRMTGTNTAPISVAFSELFIGNGSNLTEGVNGDIDDFAVYSHALTVSDAASLFSGAAPDTLPGVSATDSDLDGLPDIWEFRFYPGDLTQLTAAGADKDGDGVSNGDEFTRGLNPSTPDTDADGFSDLVETDTGVWVSLTDTGTSPFIPDTDGDSLLDGAETNTGIYLSPTNAGTNPFTKDYDGDLVEDGHEVAYGSNPTNAISTPFTPGVPLLLAWWQFNDNSTPTIARDTRAGHTGTFQGASGYSADGEGFTSTPGDRAMLTTAAGGKLFLPSATWANIGTRANKLTVSFWEKVATVSGSSSVWFTSVAAAQRGFQAHSPYTGNNIYFDTAGCCAAGQRLTGVISGVDWLQWHHYVLLKDGVNKRVYIDGVVRLSQSVASPLTTDFTSLNIGADQGTGSLIGWIDDFAVFGAALTDDEITALANKTKTPGQIGSSPDADADGLPDTWEFIYFPADLTKLGAPPADFDNDGSTDANELARLTNPNDSDSDDDGLLDGVETGTGVWVSNTDRGTNPLVADTDKDGLLDSVETNTGTFVSASDTGTNPHVADSDGDSFSDGAEVSYHTNPNNSASVPFSAGQTFLLAHWPFDDGTNPAAANDIVVGYPGATNGTYTADAGGHSGALGDRAISFVPATPNQSVTANGSFINLAAPGDAFTITLWQKLNSIRGSSAFWVGTSGALNANRGIQAHAPWSDRTLYFDHSGCCNAGIERLQGPLPLTIDPLQWHQYTFLKNGLIKQIYVDGVLTVDGQNTDPLVNDLTTLTIGGGDAGYTDGTIDDFAIFAGALNGEQITRLARGESPSTILQPLPRGFEITDARFVEGGLYRLSWSSIANYRYVVETSPTMEPGTWTPLTGFIPSGGAVTTTDVTLPAGPRIFVRIVQ